jgi:hypothetical protein
MHRLSLVPLLDLLKNCDWSNDLKETSLSIMVLGVANKVASTGAIVVVT